MRSFGAAYSENGMLLSSCIFHEDGGAHVGPGQEMECACANCVRDLIEDAEVKLDAAGRLSRRCACPLCGERAADGHHGCYIQVLAGRRTSQFVFCDACGSTCMAVLRMYGAELGEEGSLDLGALYGALQEPT